MIHSITTQKIIKLFIVTVLLYGCNFTVFAQTLTVRTITEALNYSGNSNTVTKLIITDSIAGYDYSVGSEWSKFRTLNETFPNIETVEIMTDQDIPDSYYPESARVVGLFYDSKVYHLPPNWLKHFSAPNVKKIGKHAFMRCGGLISVNFPNAIIIADLAFQYSTLVSADFPNVTTIGGNAFIMCGHLTSVNLPVVTKIGFAFYDCPILTSVSFGTGFTEPTTIDFGINVFGAGSPYPLNGTSTLKIDLTLGEYVLPKPDLVNKIWQSDNNDWYDPVWDYTSYALDYYWKSITVKEAIVSIEEVIKKCTVSIYPNPTNNTLNVELENYVNNGTLTLFDMSGKIVLSQAVNGNFAQINMFPLTAGIYILRLVENGTVSRETQVIKQ